MTDLSANFDFLGQQFPFVAESATLAERRIKGDPRASCFHARHALERLVYRVYKLDKALTPPKVQQLSAYMSEPAFLELVPQVVLQKAELIRQGGNKAVHGKQPPTPEFALELVQELFHLAYWAGTTYLRNGAEELQGRTYDASLVPPASGGHTSLKELEALQASLDERDEALREKDSELDALREKVAAIKAANARVPDTHDWGEAETRRRLIDLELQRAGWPLDQSRDREYEVTGMPNQRGIGYADYVLWGNDGKPLAVVEAKKTTVDPRKGQQQAKLYADCLEKMHGQRPLIFYTNGYRTHLWDDVLYPPRLVSGFLTRAELESLILRRSQRKALDVAKVKDEIAGRYYQKRAIGSICEHFASGHRKSLLVMATGTGKTRTSIALVDLLQRAGWVKRALFLADRISLVNQAVSAFKTHLPESSPVNLVTDKTAAGRVYVSTYPTMMGLIDEKTGEETRFGVGHFDLVIIDEAHRSVYQKYGAIFRYFDSLLVGLTATPREQVDRNTYKLFDLKPGVPTDAYELDTAVKDGFLVPPRVEQVDLRFPREGIDYDSLSDEEKEEWESLDWGDDVAPGEYPPSVDAGAINNWLFNADTIDKMLQHVMERGHKVEGGDRLAKTILFARNHDHAKAIEERFNLHYPGYKGHFARVIDYQATYPQSLINSFGQKDEDPHIAISVDMLDTGIDIPEVANLVFFKPVYSKIKFWQMIGRGTRLCPDLFGPGEDKQDFRVFDFCFNFDFFRENPDGIEGRQTIPLGTRLFQARVDLVGLLQKADEADTDGELRESVTDTLYGAISNLNRENFLVREKLQTVHHFSERSVWEPLRAPDRERLKDELAGLPGDPSSDPVESRMFDLKVLRMQLALLQGNDTGFETQRVKLVEIARLLEEKSAIPKVHAQLAYLARMQEREFWEGIDVNAVEDLRLRLRGLVPLLDKSERRIIHTDFEDEVVAIREGEFIDLPSMTSAEYEKKVREYLVNHEDHLVIHRLRSGEALTETDLKGLEQALIEIGADDGEELLAHLLTRTDAPSLAFFVRKMVGMDREAAQAAFSEFLNDRSLTPAQIRFVEMVIDQLTSRGVMKAAALYEPPFTSLDGRGPDALFEGKAEVIDGIFETLRTVNASARAEAG